jgi:hypothetical protein
VVVGLRPWSAPDWEAEPEAPSLPAGPCTNCGDERPGRYCPSCGQARRERVVSLREMLADFLDDQLSLNSRLPRTVGLLLTRPGMLTEEYLQGRIARYIRPLRLYLGASVLFFLLLPVYALLLKLLYLRRKRLYVEHFVFALHVHAFVFALFTVVLLTGGLVSGLLVVWMMVYLFLAMRRVYGQSWLKTGVKYLALGWSYFFLVSMALGVTAVVTILLA